MKACVRCGERFRSPKVFGWHLQTCTESLNLSTIYDALEVDTSGAGCWEVGHTTPKKVGIAYKRVEYAYVVVTLAQWGKPPDRIACHRCDNRLCVRADHLYWGTPSDNVTDAWRNGCRSMSHEQLQAMAAGLTRSDRHKRRMLEHNRALAEKNRGDRHWTRQSPEAMARWQEAIRAERW